MIVFIKLDNYWASYLPYAFLHMGYHLKRNKIDYKILHNTHKSEFNKDKELFLKEIADLKPKIVAFSVITGRQTRDSAEFSIEIKKKFPHIKILWGGYHPTILTKQCIEQYYIDYVLQGEADLTICDFYHEFTHNKNFEKVPGCWWKEDNTVRHSNASSPKVSPEDIGLDFSKVDLNKYLGDDRGLSLITSRGCPFNCQFCINQSLDNKKWRAFPLDLVNETIDLFLSRGAKYLHINDDNFYVNFDRAISILEHANIPSFSEIRIPTLLKDNRIKTLKDLKCKKLMSGAESCDNEILKKIQKGQTYEQMIHAAELFSKYKEIQPSWSFIIGMPVESLQTIKKTINGKQTLEKIAGRNVGPIGIYIPYPGSPMYQEALRKGFKEKREPLEWGVFERYGFNGREFPPDHEAYPWINVKEIWRLALKDYKEINMKVTMPISLKDRFRNYLSEKKKYKEYLRVQLERSKSKYNIKNELEEKRKEYFTDLVSSQVDPGNLKDTLVIGCRNPYEIDLLRKKGLNNVIGIDIFSNDRRIKVMDMHNLKFNDDSFDMIYCSHALEHAYDYEKVMLEMIRVLRNQAVIAIEVPVNYETRGSDIHDFQSSANLIGIFTFHVKIKEVFFSVDLKKGEAYNFSGTDIARVIFSINKS